MQNHKGCTLCIDMHFNGILLLSVIIVVTCFGGKKNIKHLSRDTEREQDVSKVSELRG